MLNDVGEPVTKSKRFLLNGEADTAASTSKATSAPGVLSDGAEAAATETADNDVSVFTAFHPPLAIGQFTIDSYYHYYYFIIIIIIIIIIINLFFGDH